MFIRHETIEKNAFLMLLLTLLVISIGGIVEVIPRFTIETTVEHVKGVRPYSPLESRGRDIYVREGCYNCHSQMIRALRDEVERYGHYSIAAESMYDHPFQWGSKRIGPDLARVGGKYSSDWHYAHMMNPQSVVPESLMPHYAFLAETALETDDLANRLKAQRMTGVPYTDEGIANALADLRTQADPAAAMWVIPLWRPAIGSGAAHSTTSRRPWFTAFAAVSTMRGRARCRNSRPTAC